MADSLQHKLDRVRRPRVQITYDVETNGAMQKVELPFVIGVLKKYFKSDDDALFGKIYDYYVTDSIWPVVPAATPEMFADAKDVIGKDSDKIRNLDVATIIDDAYVKSAQDRGLAGK